MENSAEYEHTFDITVKNSSEEKINSMRKILEEYKYLHVYLEHKSNKYSKKIRQSCFVSFAEQDITTHKKWSKRFPSLSSMAIFKSKDQRNSVTLCFLSKKTNEIHSFFMINDYYSYLNHLKNNYSYHSHQIYNPSLRFHNFELNLMEFLTIFYLYKLLFKFWLTNSWKI